MNSPWIVTLTAVLANGNATQLYPAYATAGVAKSSATPGQNIRAPSGGKVHSLRVIPDGTNAGTLEIWDANGEMIGADVSTAAVVTDTQIDTLVTQRMAKLLHTDSIAAAVTAENRATISLDFTKGLVARFSNAGAAGSVQLVMSVTGGHKTKQRSGS